MDKDNSRKGRNDSSAGKFIFPTFKDDFPREPTATTVKNFDQTKDLFSAQNTIRQFGASYHQLL